MSLLARAAECYGGPLPEAYESVVRGLDAATGAAGRTPATNELHEQLVDFAGGLAYFKPVYDWLRAQELLWIESAPDGRKTVVVDTGNGSTLKTPKTAVAEGSNKTPHPRVPTREPKDQAEHMRILFGSKKLRGKPSAHHTAMALHVFMGQKLRKRFGQPQPVARSLLAELTGLSERGAGQAIEYAVECGFFRRVDEGKGGGRGKNKAAVYAPVVPDYGG